MMKMTASTFIGNGSLWLYLDERLILQDSDTLTMEIGQGEEYSVYWFLKGAPGSTFSITISSPRDAQFQLTKVIGGGGKECGGFLFEA